MEERRQFVRLDTRLDVQYSVLAAGAPQPAVVKNIGGGGICMFADKELPAGTRLQVAMKLPGREAPVNFTAEVVWSEAYETIGKSQRQRAVEVGVRFVEVSPQDENAIMEHVILTYKQPHTK